MRGPRITEENLANQIAVVKEEIRVNVLNRPYGGFPWLTAAAGAVRHLPQRAQRLRRLRRPGERHRRRRRATSSTATTRPATRCSRWAATSTSTRRSRSSTSTSATCRGRPCRPGPTSTSRPSTSERRGEQLPDPLAPAAGGGGRLAGAGPGRRPRRLPAVRRARRGAHRRRRVPAGAAGWCRTTGSVTDVGGVPGLDGGRRSTCATPRAFVAARRTIPAERADATGCVAAVDEELDRLATDGLADGRARPGPGPAAGRSCCSGQRPGAGAGPWRWPSLEQQRGRAELAGELPGAARPRSRPTRSRPRPATLRPDARARLDLVAGGAW